MEVLLSFILSTQVGLSVYAVMKYRELMQQLQSKAHLLEAANMELQDVIQGRAIIVSDIVQIHKDIQLLKAKNALGGK